MAYFIAIALPALLLGGFIVLTRYEASRGTRLLGSRRASFDALVSRAVFVLRHVDWSAFIADTFKALTTRVVHDIATVTLRIVRIIERFLTSIVRSLRSARGQREALDERPQFDIKTALSRFRRPRKETPEDPA